MKKLFGKSKDESPPSNTELPDWKDELQRAKESVLYKYEDQFRNMLAETSREFREKMIRELLVESRAHDIHLMKEQLELITRQIHRLAELVGELLDGEPQPNQTLLDLVERVESLERTVGNLQRIAPRR